MYKFTQEKFDRIIEMSERLEAKAKVMQQTFVNAVLLGLDPNITIEMGKELAVLRQDIESLGNMAAIFVECNPNIVVKL